MIEHRAQHPLPHWGLPQCHWKELRQQEGPPPHSWWLKLKSIFFLLVQSGKENHGCVSVRCFLTQGSIHSLGRRSICQLFNSQYLMATVVHKAEAAQGSSGEETEVSASKLPPTGWHKPIKHSMHMFLKGCLARILSWFHMLMQPDQLLPVAECPPPRCHFSLPHTPGSSRTSFCWGGRAASHTKPCCNHPTLTPHSAPSHRVDTPATLTALGSEFVMYLRLRVMR